MRVLIIDDNPMDIEVATRMLSRRLGANVESAHTAEEGLRRLKVETFDIVLLDYSLPGQNGLDFLREMQDLKISTPVVLVTARGDTRIQEEALQAGAVDYISKDESLTPALSRAVEAAAERGRATQAFKERDRAEELRQNAEKIIAAQDERIQQLELSIGLSHVPEKSRLDTLSQDARDDTIAQLSQTYSGLMWNWTGSSAEAQKARDAIPPFVAQMFRLGISGEQLLSLHTATCQMLREQKRDMPPPQSGCSPRMLLLELSLALLDAYRNAALSCA